MFHISIISKVHLQLMEISVAGCISYTRLMLLLVRHVLYVAFYRL
uniref:Uncharacterized protein n=1 Tax=Arundo donax TaxID=35708 RepID=A0A0A9B7P6_ARUDO